MLDARGRPYFLWDIELTLPQFLARLRDPNRVVRAYSIGKLMRQAKPDDVLTLVTLDELDRAWPDAERYLGRSKPFWEWLLGWWRAHRGGK